jgi:C4-dicarboxylate transporter DctM subunit
MAAVALIILLGLLGLGISIAAALGGLGLALGALFSDMPLYLAMGEITWGISTKILLFTIPLFMMLGAIMVQTGMAGPMYQALSQWLAWLPGGLMHTNIGASAMFAATSGSSAATAAVIGQMSLPLL